MWNGEIIMCQYLLKTYFEKQLNSSFNSFVLGVDIGGTNTNIAIAGVANDKPTLIFSLNFKTNEIQSFLSAVQEALNYAKNQYDIEIHHACIGAAGVVSSSGDFADLTNIELSVDANKIMGDTSLHSVFVINDFQAVGYGINLLDNSKSEDVFIAKKGNNEDVSCKKTRAIIGAGTGLGKSMLVYDAHMNAYIPLASEGGHSDFPAQNNFELKLCDFLKKVRNFNEPVCYEELLSGRGVEGIYMFLKSQDGDESDVSRSIEDSDNKPELIFKNKNNDSVCRETFRLFSMVYGRCAKNFVLDTMATGGLYIAGGIASKNKDIFTSDVFLNEFSNAYKRKDVLDQTSINVIMNYDVSLYGACFAAMLKGL